MMNKITISLLIILLVLVGGLGYYAWSFHQQISLLSEELNVFQSEQSLRTETISGEIASLNSELRSGLDNLGTEINENIAHITDLEGSVDSNRAEIQALETKVNSNVASIDTIEQELAETTEVAGAVLDAPDLYSKVSEAVVRISNGQRTVGSGFLYSAEGHVLTAHHVIDELDEIYVIIPDGKIYPADVVGFCALSDVAVLKLDGEPGAAPPEISDSSQIEVGDSVAVIGSPFDLAGSLNTGIVSQMNRYAEIEYDEQQTRWVASLIQFDAAVNFGNSGGPLFNSDGGVIGLVIARVEPERGDGIYYAVASNKLKLVADSIIDQGYFDYPWLGVNISDLTPQQVQDLNLASINGVLVNKVVAGGPSETAGVQANDIIIAIDDTEIRNLAVLTSYLGEHLRPGESTTLTVIRDKAALEISLEVGLWQQ